MLHSNVISFSIGEEFGNIENFFYQSLVPQAKEVISKLRKSNHPSIMERSPFIGGVLRLIEFDEENSKELLSLNEKIGVPNPKKIGKYYHLSEEKITRSEKNFREKGHNRSDQSLDESKNQYAGGIIVRIGDKIVGISFSGLPQWADKALCLAILNSTEQVISDYYSEDTDGIEMFKIATAA